MIPGVLAGLAATVVVSLFTSPPHGAAAEFDAVRRAVGRPFRKRRTVAGAPDAGRPAPVPVGGASRLGDGPGAGRTGTSTISRT